MYVRIVRYVHAYTGGKPMPQRLIYRSGTIK